MGLAPPVLRSSIKQSYELISRLGFKPQVVIDVGVAKGTPELYEVFPDAYFLLIEPLEQFEPVMQAVVSRLRGSYVLAAAGPHAGNVTFNVHDDHLGGSSLFKEFMGPEADGHEIVVPMVRIDDVLAERNITGQFLIKIDVQGAELGVLDGAKQALQSAEVVALEVSLFRFMGEQPDLHDVVVYMKACGFVAYDIVLGWNRPLDGALGQIDMVFVKEYGRFRRDHSYSTREQLKQIFSP